MAGGEETAVWDEREEGRGKCLILDGDWRKQYEEAVPNGVDAVLAVYEANKVKHRSKWSEDEPYTPTDTEVMEVILGGLRKATTGKI